jgi:hypothetical protein
MGGGIVGAAGAMEIDAVEGGGGVGERTEKMGEDPCDD